MALTLSDRQKQVVRLLSLGCTAAEAAKMLSLTPKGVIICKERAMQKFGVNKVALLTRMALKHRITSLKDKLTPAEKSMCEHRPSTRIRQRHLVPAELTEKEAQVVRLTSLGCTQREAAAILKVAPTAVDTRKSRAMAKLDVNKTAILTRLALKHRITSMKDKLTLTEKRRSGRKRDGWN